MPQLKIDNRLIDLNKQIGYLECLLNIQRQVGDISGTLETDLYNAFSRILPERYSEESFQPDGDQDKLSLVEIVSMSVISAIHHHFDETSAVIIAMPPDTGMIIIPFIIGGLPFQMIEIKEDGGPSKKIMHEALLRKEKKVFLEDSAISDLIVPKYYEETWMFHQIKLSTNNG